MSRQHLATSTLVLALAMTITMNPQDQQRGTVSGETADREYQRGQEIGDLYQRAAASRFVVVGSVVNLDLVADRSLQGPTMDENLGGFLYSIAIEKTVCRQADFAADLVNSPPPTEADPVVYLFVPYKPLAPGKEKLQLGQRYLLFLLVPDPQQQKAWTASFQLDPQRLYLRAEEQARGVVPLPLQTSDDSAANSPEVLDKVSQLCQAVRPAAVPEKLAALNKLAVSGDPILRHEAQEAIRALSHPRE